MNKLYNKTILTVFTLLSLFLLVGITLANIVAYQREYTNVERNLDFNNFNLFKDKTKQNKEDKDTQEKEPPKIDNMMIMDYEVYTVQVKDNAIESIISHGYTDNIDEITSLANYVIKNDDRGNNIGDLYFSDYAYNYTGNTITIINLDNINKKLRMQLLRSFFIIVIFEVLINFIAGMLAKWITKPALDAYQKQKDFIADASHELKTPLSVIMASADELKSDKKNAKYIDNIKYESDRMTKLISSMLDLSKIESGVLIGSYKDENISKIIEKTCLTFEALAFENNIAIESNVEENITFNCSKTEIEKLISILLDNAIKHSNKNTTINVNVKKNKNNINIEIINIGDKIKPEDEEKIFERFYRIDKARNRSENRYGLGLAIAKSIVINHRGTIKAHSDNEKTIFTINFKK